MIRPGKAEDIDRAIPVVQRFHSEILAGFGFLGDVDKITQMARGTVEHSFVAEIDGRIVGIISGMIVTGISDNELIFQEVIWYVLPEERKSIGLKLYAAMEKKCREMGVKRMVMISMCNEKGKDAARIYELLGYRPLETHHVKDLT